MSSSQCFVQSGQDSLHLLYARLYPKHRRLWKPDRIEKSSSDEDFGLWFDRTLVVYFNCIGEYFSLGILSMLLFQVFLSWRLGCLAKKTWSQALKFISFYAKYAENQATFSRKYFQILPYGILAFFKNNSSSNKMYCKRRRFRQKHFRWVASGSVVRSSVY